MKLRIRRCAELLTDFPNDTIEDEFDIVVYGGRGVADALAEIFRDLGYDADTSNYAGDRGWDFVVRLHSYTVIFQVTDFADGKYILATRPANKSQRTITPQAILLIELNAALARDARFKNVSWFRSEDLFGDVPGHASPVDENDLPAMMLEREKLLAGAQSRKRGAQSDDPSASRGRTGFLARLLAAFRLR